MDPEQGVRVEGPIGVAGAISPRGLGERALDVAVDPVDAAGGGEGVVEGAEADGVDVLEGAAEASGDVLARAGVLVDRRGHEGVGELQERGAPARHEERALPIDLPADAPRPVDPGAGIGRTVLDLTDGVLDDRQGVHRKSLPCRPGRSHRPPGVLGRRTPSFGRDP